VGPPIRSRADTADRLVAVYADESCIGNGRLGDNPGGAGGLVEYRHPGTGKIVRRDYWVSEPATTNNRMALRSVIEVARALSAKGSRLRVVFTSDSRYLVDGLGSWVHNWARRGWTRKTGRIENLALWREALAALRSSGHEYEWRWVRGHANHAQNEYANHLVPSGFETWLSAFNVRDSARSPMLPDPFPDPDSFTPGASLPDPGASLPQSTTGRRG
jgi:ribonuclease HI